MIHIEKNREFDQDIWKESKGESKMIKYEMIDNLVKNELIINKDSAEVKAFWGCRSTKIINQIIGSTMQVWETDLDSLSIY